MLPMVWKAVNKNLQRQLSINYIEAYILSSLTWIQSLGLKRSRNADPWLIAVILSLFFRKHNFVVGNAIKINKLSNKTAPKAGMLCNEKMFHSKLLNL